MGEMEGCGVRFLEDAERIEENIENIRNVTIYTKEPNMFGGEPKFFKVSIQYHKSKLWEVVSRIDNENYKWCKQHGKTVERISQGSPYLPWSYHCCNQNVKEGEFYETEHAQYKLISRTNERVRQVQSCEDYKFRGECCDGIVWDFVAHEFQHDKTSKDLKALLNDKQGIEADKVIQKIIKEVFEDTPEFYKDYLDKCRWEYRPKHFAKVELADALTITDKEEISKDQLISEEANYINIREEKGGYSMLGRIKRKIACNDIFWDTSRQYDEQVEINSLIDDKVIERLRCQSERNYYICPHCPAHETYNEMEGRESFPH